MTFLCVRACVHVYAWISTFKFCWLICLISLIEMAFCSQKTRADAPVVKCWMLPEGHRTKKTRWRRRFLKTPGRTVKTWTTGSLLVRIPPTWDSSAWTTCPMLPVSLIREYYHCTVDLLFDWFGISCMTTDNFLFLFTKQTNPNQSNRRSAVKWYCPL